MRSLIFSLLFFFSLLSCSQQQVKFKIIIINRSSFAIDSINIPPVNLMIKEKINSNITKTILVDKITPYPSEECPLLLFIYQRGKSFKATWGFCDFGECISFGKPIYFYDHGVSETAILAK